MKLYYFAQGTNAYTEDEQVKVYQLTNGKWAGRAHADMYPCVVGALTAEGAAEAVYSVLSGRNPIPSSAALTPGDAGGEGHGQGERVKELEGLLNNAAADFTANKECATAGALAGLRLRIAELEAEVARLTDAMTWSEAKTEEENVSLRAQLAAAKEGLAHAERSVETHANEGGRLRNKLAALPQPITCKEPAESKVDAARPATDGKDGERTQFLVNRLKYAIANGKSHPPERTEVDDYLLADLLHFVSAALSKPTPSAKE